MRCAVVALALAACSSPLTVTERPVPVPTRPPDRLPPASTHVGVIERVAVTERGDAAVSVDSQGEVRLWPTLDGMREPVRVDLVAPAQLAIGHDGDELVVGFLDGAGNAGLVRLSRGGAPRAAASLAGDSPALQIAAVETAGPAGPTTAFLVVRADQTIERFDATGARRGRIAAEPGHRLGALAVRRGGAAVLELAAIARPLATRPDPDVVRREQLALLEDEPMIRPGSSAPAQVFDADAVQLIELGGGIAWGQRLALPEPALGTLIALSPSHRRVSVVTADGEYLVVYRRAGAALEPDMRTAGLGRAHDGIGFAGEDRLGAFAGGFAYWTMLNGRPDSSGLTMPDTVKSLVTLGDAPVFADDLAVGERDGSLAIVAPEHVGFLGWAESATGRLERAGSGFALIESRDGEIIDADLHRQRALDLVGGPTPRPNASFAHMLDGHHALLARVLDDTWTAEVATFDDGGRIAHEVVLGTSPNVGLSQYRPEQHVLAVGDGASVHRFVVDDELTRAKQIPDLALPTTDESTLRIQAVRLADARAVAADGVVATGAASFGNRWRSVVWRAGEFAPEPELGGTAHRGTVLAIDAGGGIWSAHERLSIWHGEQETSLVDGRVNMFALAPDEQHFALAQGPSVTMRDRAGRVLWERAVWGATGGEISADGRRLLVQTEAGLIELDAATGDRVATACAFGFGLHDQAPAHAPAAGPTVCED